MASVSTPWSRGRVLVTGAGGAVGSALVPRLLQAGWRVRATALPRTPLNDQGRDGVEVVRGDLTDPAFAPTVVAGCDVVIHCAALIDITLDWATLKPINLDAVKWLYEAARTAGVRRFIQLSSASLYAPGSAPHREDDPLLATSAYEQTKLEAERWLRAQTAGPEVVIVRPSMIYGPRNRDLAAILPALPPLCSTFLKFGIGLSGGPITNWVHAEDVAAAVALLAEHPEAAGGTFNVADLTRKPFGAMLDSVYAAYGITPRIRIPLNLIPKPLLRWLFTNATILRLLNRMIGGGWAKVVERYGLDPQLRPKVFPDIGNYATSNWIFATDRIEALGWRPRFADEREGWRDAVHWYQAHAWVPQLTQGLGQRGEIEYRPVNLSTGG